MPVRSRTQTQALAAAIGKAQDALADAVRSALGMQPQAVPVRIDGRRRPLAGPARGDRW